MNVYKQWKHLSDINYHNNNAPSMYFRPINALPPNTSSCWPKCCYTLRDIWKITKNVIETSMALLVNTQAYVHTFLPLFFGNRVRTASEKRQCCVIFCGNLFAAKWRSLLWSYQESPLELDQHIFFLSVCVRSLRSVYMCFDKRRWCSLTTPAQFVCIYIQNISDEE